MNKRELKKLSFIFLKKFLNFMLVKFLFWNNITIKKCKLRSLK
nr:MAG TPA: hypothetical protein [Caudoviricetes sp.]